MYNSTSKTYKMKRKIITFSNKISLDLHKPQRKFFADMTYGILASNSCLLTDITDQLHETNKKVNIVERLANQLSKGIYEKSSKKYLKWVKSITPDYPTIHIDDTDIVKPDGYKFEALGLVRDGSASASAKNVYSKGYHVTEAVALTENGNPISIYSTIHSSAEKEYKSINTHTFSAIETGVSLYGKATFVMDRGYDGNKTFNRLNDLNQDYIIRITKKRKLFYRNKWVTSTELCNRRKGKIKLPLFYRGKEQTAYISHIKSQITASRNHVTLVLVYGITEHPMMLVTNKDIKAKEDVIQVAKKYFSRWRIEEYFRCKKQQFGFENFRVRKLKAINALNFHLTICMSFLAIMAEQSETNCLKVMIMKKANAVRQKVFFTYYRLAKGIKGMLAYAHEGVRRWYKTKRPKYRQQVLKLTA